MGEIAEDMLDGSCCSLCGQYFLDPKSKKNAIYSHGYPVDCKDCWEPGSGRSKATVDTF